MTDKTRRTASRPWRLPLLALALAAALIAAVFVAGIDTAKAQGGDNDYVDVGLVVEVPDNEDALLNLDLKVIVVNHGTRTAYDVVVVVNTVYPATGSPFHSSHVGPPRVPVGSAENNGRTFRWTIPVLGGLQRVEFAPRVRIREKVTSPAWNNSLYVHEFFGKVTTSSFENDLHKGNNTSRVWSYNYNIANDRHRQAAGNYTVAVSVDNASPSPGDTVNFTISATRAHPYVKGGRTPPIDLKVDIELTGGLTVSGAPRYVSTDGADTTVTTPSSVSYADHVFTVGTLKARAGPAITNAVTLPVTVASGAGGTQQCLTATLTGNPPPGTGRYDDDISDNVAKVCLGAPPAGTQVVLKDGTVDLFTWYDCVGKTAAPCQDNDSLELVVLSGTAAPEVGSVFQPSQVVVHIPDPEGRTVDNSSNLVWSTGVANFTGLPGSKDRPGAVLAVNASLLNYMSTTNDPGNWGVDHPQWSDWHTGRIKVTAVVPTDDQGSPLGEIKGWRKTNPPDQRMWGNDVDPNDNTNPALLMEDDIYLGDSTKAVGGWRDERYIEFSALGTYLLTVTTTIEYDDDGDSNTNTVSYSDTETYTFHVGPMAELEVRDGGASPDLATNQYAITINALSNGQEDPLDAEVTIDLSGLPPGVTVDRHIASDGTYSNGTWDLGVLKPPDYRRSAGKPEAASLTLILAGANAASATATATIANVTDYSVCIGSDASTLDHTAQSACEADTSNGGSWHTGPVYDYNPGNNTATIAARAGSPSTHGASAQAHPAAATVTWDPVKTLYGLPVSHYEVEWSSTGVGGWTSLAGDAAQPRQVDTTIQSGVSLFYRLRAVNLAGIEGPWSAPIIVRTGGVTAVPSAPTGVSASPDGANAIDVSWAAPLDDGDLPLTRYEVQWSADGATGWRTAGSTADAGTLTFKHTGLTFGTTRYYRVAARNGRGLGDWSGPSHPSATTLSGVPGQPRLTARASDANTIALTWTAPSDNGDPVTHYDLEWSPDGTTNSWSGLANPGASETSYDDAGLDPGTQRHYRLRAVNGMGDGSWSREVDATTPPDVPARPRLTASASGDSVIELTWTAPDSRGAPIDGYELQVLSTSGWTGLTSPSAAATSYTDSGLDPGATRSYRLRAGNRAGWSEWSETAEAQTTAGAPGTPVLTAVANGSTEIKITWTKPDARGGYIQGYRLDQSDDGSDWEHWVFVRPKAGNIYLHQGLSGGTTRYYRVRAASIADGDLVDGPWSNTARATTDAQQPEAPTLTATASGSNQIDLTWTTPSTNGSAVTGYRIERSRNGKAPWKTLATRHGSGSTTSYSDTRDLYGGMTRYYRVAAVTGTGTGAFSSVASATTAGTPARVPGVPRIVWISDLGRDHLTLSWDPPGSDGGAPITGYQYAVSRPCEDGSEASCGFGGAIDTGATSVTLRNLKANGAYYFRVRAMNAVGGSGWSRDAYTLAFIRPSSPARVIVSPTTLNVDEGGSATYNVRLSTSPTRPVQVYLWWSIEEGDEDLHEDLVANQGQILVPDGWVWPEGHDFSDWSSNWRDGVTITVRASEDGDASNGATVITHAITTLPGAWIGDPPDWDYDPDYDGLTGAGVRAVERDND